MRSSKDNHIVGSPTAHFPVRKLFSFYSIFADLLPPKDFSQPLDSACQMPAIRAERQVEQFCGSLLGGSGMKISPVESMEQFLIPRMDT